MKANEQKLREQLNKLAEREREFEQERMETFRAWVGSRAEKIRAGKEPEVDRPLLRDGEFEWLSRKEQLLRDRVADQPLLDRAIANANALNAEEQARLSGNAA
jgi:hypothetical protein